MRRRANSSAKRGSARAQDDVRELARRRAEAVDAVVAAEGIEIDADATGTQASRKIARARRRASYS